MPKDTPSIHMTRALVRHPQYGPAIPDLNWVPAPRYLLRRDLILSAFRDLPPGRLLEIGCGAGALLDDLAGLGFEALGVDQSPAALRIAEAILADTQAARVAAKHEDQPEESFDYLAAFEVLEHIEDDLGALTDWARHLKTGGTALLSVPAHPERWNPADEWAGHYRRYRREGLCEMVEAAGFEIETVQCYGFPLANIMERLSAGIYARQTEARGASAMDQDERTSESGSDRKLLTRLWPIYSSLPATWAMRLIWRVQRMFLNTDRGIGYFVVARKI